MTNEIKSEQVTIKTHEQFMREASKQIVENLKQINKEVSIIRSWVLFFGIVSLIGLVFGLLFGFLF